MRTNDRKTRVITMAAALALVVLVPGTADAYAGPGSGLTVIGAAVAFIGALFLAIVGFIWYPIKRLLRRRAARPKAAPGVADTATQ